MSRPKSKSEAEGQRERPGLRLKIYIRDDMIGGGKIDLLQMVAEEGSIAGAARRFGVDYKRAWFLLDTLQRCFDEPLIETRRGGAAAQGAEVTALGRELITRYRETSTQLTASAQDFLGWLETRQRRAED